MNDSKQRIPLSSTRRMVARVVGLGHLTGVGSPGQYYRAIL